MHLYFLSSHMLLNMCESADFVVGVRKAGQCKRWGTLIRSGGDGGDADR